MNCAASQGQRGELMQRSAFTVFATFAAVLALQGCGHHGGPGEVRTGGPGGVAASPPEGLQLKVFDLDGDGRITRDELERALRIELAKYDTDKDGNLDRAEAGVLNDLRRAEGGTASPALDWNADGHVDFKEFANQWLSLFDRTDIDGDGVVTTREMSPPLDPHGGRRRGSRPDGSSSGGGRPDTVGQ
jgi:EF hand domain-containing protein